ncbi:MAG: hypothetical protein QOG85_1044 [Gaiellaceae bacterium]|jgi:hypothetical protein|nr:hypothetical protein [Gaiellaceae bacterium]
MTGVTSDVPFPVDPLIAEAKRRMRRRWFAVALIVLLLAGGIGAGLALRSSGPSQVTGPHGVLGSMVAAALTQKSVRWTESGGEDMRGSWRSTSDLTANSGEQRLTLPPTDGEADIRFVNGVVYVEGNPAGLQWTLSLTDAQATRYAGQWISVPTSDDLYARTSDGLTLASLVRNVTSPDLGASFPPRVIRTKLGGTSVIDFVEGEPGRGGPSLKVSTRAGGNGLPIYAAVDFGPGTSFAGRFSNWNEPVHVRAPAHSIPLASVRRG